MTEYNDVEFDRAACDLVEARRSLGAVGPSNRSMAWYWIAEAEAAIGEWESARQAATTALDSAIELENDPDIWPFPNGLFWAAKALRLVGKDEDLKRIREIVSNNMEMIGRNQWLQTAAVSRSISVLKKVAKDARPTLFSGWIVRPGNLALALSDVGIEDLRNQAFKDVGARSEPAAAGEPDAQKRYVWALAIAGDIERALNCAARISSDEERAKAPGHVVETMLAVEHSQDLDARALGLCESLSLSKDWRVLSYLCPTLYALGSTNRAVELAESVCRLGILPSEETCLSLPPPQTDAAIVDGRIVKVGKRVMAPDTLALEDEEAAKNCETLAREGRIAAAEGALNGIRIPKYRAQALEALAVHNDDADEAFRYWCEALLEARLVSRDLVERFLKKCEPLLRRLELTESPQTLWQSLDEVNERWRGVG